jgi:7,8-dihydropterin-6-yl-methyl-4-(beta-D-ribofuranosyl)aminobenzene 5'-phosphate synthase
MRKFNIPPNSIDRVAISHGHMDHVRGIKALAKVRTSDEKLLVFGHPNILEPKRAQLFGRLLWNAGFPNIEPELNEKLEFRFNREITEIEPKIFLSGEFPLEERKEEQNLSRFFWHEVDGKWQHDPMLDEQCLVIQTKKGLVVLSGDSHPGLANTIKRIEKLFGEKIHVFIGGVHLTRTTNKKIVKIASDIKQDFNHIKFYLNHTSISRAIRYFRIKLGEGIINYFFLGSELIFEY